MLVLEKADYVLTGSRSKLRAVVTLSEGLRKRERGETAPDVEGKQNVDSCHSTLDPPEMKLAVKSCISTLRVKRRP